MAPILRHMHPIGHQGRRRARAEAMTRIYQNRKNTVHVNAGTYVNGRDAVVTMIEFPTKGQRIAGDLHPV